MNSSEAQIWWGQLVNLGVNIAGGVVGHAVSAPVYIQTLPFLLLPVIAGILAIFHVHVARLSYAAQLNAGIVMPQATPVGVGTGPPPGPAAEVVPVGAGPEQSSDVDHTTLPGVQHAGLPAPGPSVGPGGGQV